VARGRYPRRRSKSLCHKELVEGRAKALGSVGYQVGPMALVTVGSAFNSSAGLWKRRVGSFSRSTSSRVLHEKSLPRRNDETLSGNSVIMLAPSSSAVGVLKSEGFSKAETFQRFHTGTDAPGLSEPCVGMS
jgi:hypothetical protein